MPENGHVVQVAEFSSDIRPIDKLDSLSCKLYSLACNDTVYTASIEKPAIKDAERQAACLACEYGLSSSNEGFLNVGAGGGGALPCILGGIVGGVMQDQAVQGICGW